MRKQRSGYVLMAVLAVIAILVTIIAVLQYQGMARRRNAVVMEAQYLANRAFDGAHSVMEANLDGQVVDGMDEIVPLDDDVVSMKVGGNPTGSLDNNSVYIDLEVYSRGKGYGSNIFKNRGKRNLGTTDEVLGQVELHDRDRTSHPMSIRVEGQPTSWNPTYDLFTRNRFQAVYLSGFPYAAFAPGADSRIEIEKLRTWAMPTIDEYNPNEVNPLDLNNGLTPYVGAGGDVTVNDVEYARLYSQAGEVEMDSGQAISFVGHLPYARVGGKSYFSHLQESVERVTRELDSVSTDKTAAVFGKLSLNQTINWLIKGKTPSNFLSYQSASAWWFFLIPSYTSDFGTVNFKIHVPLPADVSMAWDAIGTAPALSSLDSLREQNDKLNEQLLPDGVSEETEDWNSSTPGLLPKLYFAAEKYNAEAEKLDDLETQYEQMRESGSDQNQLDAKLDAIDRQRDIVDDLHDVVEELDQQVQRKEDAIEHNREQIEELRDQVEGVAMDWVEGDPKGPSQLVETVMSWTRIGSTPKNGTVTGTQPANASQQKDSTASKGKADKYWLSQRGMVYHSYVALLGRLSAQVRRIIENAIRSFPMKKIKIRIRVPGVKKFKTKLKVLPDLKKLPGWLKGVGQTINEGLMNLVVYEVPLLYLGGKPIEKIGGNNFKIYDTFQVPMGRTFKLQGDMTIHGDLWLQQGSSMTVTGNLTMKRPKEQTDSALVGFHTMMTPRGRIYLEEGASLVVGGDLEGAGDKFLGSVVACGPMGANRAITSAILCDGRITLPHGTAGGVDFVNLVEWVGEESYANGFRRFFEDWAPNLSKAPAWLSPIWWRAPYFGKYPVVFKIVPPSPVPIPTFELTGQNLNCYLFRILTNAFSAQMNLSLGENFTTNCLWWPWGAEQVAVFPKHSGPGFKSKVAQEAKEWGALLEWAEGDVKDFMEPLIKGAVKDAKDVDGLGKKLLMTTAMALNPDPTGQSNVAVEEMMDNIMGDNSIGGKTRKAMLDLNLPMRVPGGGDMDIWAELKKELRDLQNAVNGLSPSSGISASKNQLRESANILLVECPGVYVYAGDSLIVGGEDTVRAVGCFVSEGDVTMDVEYTIGAIISGDGNIFARQLYHAPQYARVSVYIPEPLRKGGKGIGALDDLWDNALNFKYGSQLDSETSMSIPESGGYYRAASGWSR